MVVPKFGAHLKVSRARRLVSFRLKLKVESPDFPVDEMAESVAWKGLQARVDAYGDRLETTREENRRRMMVTSILYLCSAIGMAVTAYQTPAGDEPAL